MSEPAEKFELGDGHRRKNYENERQIYTDRQKRRAGGSIFQQAGRFLTCGIYDPCSKGQTMITKQSPLQDADFIHNLKKNMIRTMEVRLPASNPG